MKRNILNMLVVVLTGTMFNVHASQDVLARMSQEMTTCSSQTRASNNNKKGMFALCAVGATLAALYYGSDVIKRLWRTTPARRNVGSAVLGQHMQPVLPSVISAAQLASSSSSANVAGQVAKSVQPIFIDQIRSLLACLQNNVQGNIDNSYAEIIHSIDQKAIELAQLRLVQHSPLLRIYVNQLQQTIDFVKAHQKNDFIIQLSIAEIIEYLLSFERSGAALTEQEYTAMLAHNDALRNLLHQQESKSYSKGVLSKSASSSSLERAAAVVQDAHLILNQLQLDELQYAHDSDESSEQSGQASIASSTDVSSVASDAGSDEQREMSASAFLLRQGFKGQASRSISSSSSGTKKIRLAQLLEKDLPKFETALQSLYRMRDLLDALINNLQAKKSLDDRQQINGMSDIGNCIDLVESKMKTISSQWRTQQLEPMPLVAQIKLTYKQKDFSALAAKTSSLIELLELMRSNYSQVSEQ